MSTLQDLKQKELAAAEKFNNLNEDPNYQSLRSRAQEQFAEYRRLSAETDAAFKAGNIQETERLRQEASAALSASNEIDREFKPLRKQLETYKAEFDIAQAQVRELSSTSTQPEENQKTQFDKQTEVATKQASETEPPVPPPEERNLPTAEDEPLRYAASNNQAPFVLNSFQTTALEKYNKRREEQGLPPIDPGSNEAIDLVIETGSILPDDDGFPVGQSFGQSDVSSGSGGGFIGETPVEQQTVNTEPGTSVTISGVAFEEFQADGGFGEESTTGGGFTAEFPSTQVQPMINTAREQAVGKPAADIRFRIKLADRADYFYNADRPGILAPLRATNGVIFPYTPLVTVSYTASYTPLDVVHTNYKFYSYKNSSVENINITGDFTAQNTVEANYLLAVIHFFRSATKMFYGQDQNPSRGVPPPLMYISGYGPYQFDNHPVVITNFTYNLPQDVDYIDAYPTNNTNALGGLNLAPYTPTAARFTSPLDRLRSLVSSGIAKGGLPPPPNFQNSQNINESTRVPTKINIQITCLPIATRNAVSNKFSLKDYANGSLLRGSVNPGTGGGFW